MVTAIPRTNQANRLVIPAREPRVIAFATALRNFCRASILTRWARESALTRTFNEVPISPDEFLKEVACLISKPPREIRERLFAVLETANSRKINQCLDFITSPAKPTPPPPEVPRPYAYSQPTAPKPPVTPTPDPHFAMLETLKTKLAARDFDALEASLRQYCEIETDKGTFYHIFIGLAIEIEKILSTVQDHPERLQLITRIIEIGLLLPNTTKYDFLQHPFTDGSHFPREENFEQGADLFILADFPKQRLSMLKLIFDRTVKNDWGASLNIELAIGFAEYLIGTHSSLFVNYLADVKAFVQEIKAAYQTELQKEASDPNQEYSWFLSSEDIYSIWQKYLPEIE